MIKQEISEHGVVNLKKRYDVRLTYEKRDTAE